MRAVPARSLVGVVAVAVTIVACAPGGAVERDRSAPIVGLLRVIADEDQAAFVAELSARGWRPGRVDVRPDDPEAVAAVLAHDVIEDELVDAGLPAIANTDFVAFAVVVLAPDSAEVRRQLAPQAARILSGADVSSVPVEDPRRFVTIVDRRIAASLGLGPIDPDVLRQMDVVR